MQKQTRWLISLMADGQWAWWLIKKWLLSMIDFRHDSKRPRDVGNRLID